MQIVGNQLSEQRYLEGITLSHKQILGGDVRIGGGKLGVEKHLY